MADTPAGVRQCYYPSSNCFLAARFTLEGRIPCRTSKGRHSSLIRRVYKLRQALAKNRPLTAGEREDIDFLNAVFGGAWLSHDTLEGEKWRMQAISQPNGL